MAPISGAGRASAWALAVTLALAGVSGAQEAGSEEPLWRGELAQGTARLMGPWTAETWSSMQLRRLRRLLERGDRRALEAYARERFVPGLLEQDDGAILDSLLEIAGGGDLELRAFGQSGEEQAELLLRSSAQPERWLRLAVAVEEEDPYRVSEVVLEPVPAGDEGALFAPYPEDELPARLHAALTELAEWHRFSGAVLVARNRKPVLRKAYGPADLEWQVPNEVTTRFDLASLDQMFTAVVVARMVEQGGLAFEDAIGKHLEGWVAPEVGAAVTVQHLLTHTSGLGDYREGALLLPRGQPLRELADYKPITLADRPAFEPGTRHRESTTGYLLLGAIIESVSGKPYAEVLLESVRGPAMMIDTGMFAVDEIAGPRATGYEPTAPPGLRSRRRSWRSNVAGLGWCGTPGGGGWSNVDDLLSFTLRLQQHHLLSEQMTERLLTPQPDPSGSGRGLAHGFEVVPSPGGGRAWRHVGDWPGASAVLELHERRGYVFVALSNETAGTDVARDLFQHLLVSAVAERGR